jgi:YYY domain-containing protein
VGSLGIVEAIIWLVVTQLLSFAVLPYVAWFCPRVPDRGYGLSKVLGVLLFASIVWLCALAGLTTESNRLIYAIFAFLLFLGFRGYASGWLSFAEARSLIREHGRGVEGVFIGLTLFYGVIRFLNPEIFWGEKPMDSTFLNFFVRNDALPPQDPWAAGSKMSYYYLGMYVMAAMLKLTAIVPSIGYNLAMATVAGWIGAALYTLCLILTGNRRFTVWAVWLLLLASNPEVLRLSVRNLIVGREFNFDTTFWPSTRVFTSPNFLEYTSWSLLFADLHAHVMAIPFTVVALTLATVLFLDPLSRYTGHGVFLRLVLGGVTGALFGLNTWDFISFGGIVGVLIVCARVPTFWKPPVGADGRPMLGEVVLATLFARGAALVWDLALFGVSAGLAVWLYQQGVSFRPGGGWGWVATPEFNSMLMLFRVMGYWLVAMLAAVLVIGWERLRDFARLPIPAVLGAALVFGMILVPGMLSVTKGNHMQPWGSFIYCATLASIVFLSLWYGSKRAEHRVLALFIGCAAALIVILEIFFLLDRMNTLFKGYMAVWMLSGIATMVGGYYAYEALRNSGARRLACWAKRVGYVFAALLLLGTAVNVYAIVKLKRVPKRTYTLDGIAFIKDMNAEDAALIAWLNANVKGTPTILEAHGDGYREFTRISMHTGLPVVLGWEHHAKQRGLSPEDAQKRKKAVQTIYTSEDLELTRQLLLDLRVDYVIIGSVERNSYRRLNLDKFDSHPELFTKVASFGAANLYVTYFSKYNPIYQSVER